jgi:hypothetical protein
MKQLFHFFEEKNTLSVSAILTFLLFCCMGWTAAFADNVISGGSTVKVVTGTHSVSVSDFVIKSGATLTNSGMLILQNKLINENGTPNPLGTGTVTLAGTTLQTVTGQNIFQNFIIDNLSGVTIGGNTGVNGTMTLTSGKVTIGDYNLLLGSLANISGTYSSANMIIATAVGELRKTFLSGFTGSYTFPVGDNTDTPEYSPVTLNFIAGTFVTDNYVGINLRNIKYPDPLITGNYLKRYWNISKSGISSLSCNAVFHYVPADIVGNESIISCMRITPTPVITYDFANTVTHQLTANGITSFGSYTGGSQLGFSPALTGPTPICANSTGNVYTTDIGKTNYVWVVSAGGTITSGGTSTDNTATITWNTAGDQTVSVNYDGASGPKVLNVLVNPLPVPVLNGSSTECLYNVATYSTASGMTNYIWLVSAGGTITTGGGLTNNWVTVKWMSPGSQLVSVNYTNVNGCVAATPTVKNITVTGPTLSGPTLVCKGSKNNTYTTEAGKTAYTWVISYGGTKTAGGNGYNYVKVTWTVTGNRSVKVTYTDGTCTAYTVLPVTVLPVQPGISGPGILCKDASGTFETEPGMTAYTWTVSSGGTITSGAGTNTVTAHWTSTGAQTISCLYTNPAGCTAVSPTVFNLTVNSLPVPTINATTGPSPCVSPGNVYSTEAGMANYSWEVSAGGTITSGTGTNSITVTWNSTGKQTVSVNYSNANGCTAVAPTVYNVMVNPLPVPVITGQVSVIVNTTYQYSTESGMTNYLWTVSSGGTITSGGGMADSWANILWSGLGSQTVSVNYNNAYGCSASIPTTLNVTVNPPPMSPGSDPTANNRTDNTDNLNETLTRAQLSEFSVYPVPNDGNFTISMTSLKKENYSISIYNYLGVEVYNLKNLTIDGVYKQKVDISSTTEGVYMVIIRNQDNQVSRRIIIRK